MSILTNSSSLVNLVGEQLRFIREEKGLSQEKLAELAGMAHARISRIETSKDNPTLKTLEKIIDALEISPLEFFHYQRLNTNTDIMNKKLLIDIHQGVLLERDLGEVKYVVNTTKEFLETIDKKEGK